MCRLKPHAAIFGQTSFICGFVVSAFLHGRAHTHTHTIFDHLHFTHCLLISSQSILNIVRPSPSCRGPSRCLSLLLKVRSDLQKENRTSPTARGTETRLHADRCILWRPDRLSEMLKEEIQKVAYTVKGRHNQM